MNARRELAVRALTCENDRPRSKGEGERQEYAERDIERMRKANPVLFHVTPERDCALNH